MSSPRARQELARIIDYVLLQPDATRRQVEAACAEARTQGLFGLAVNSSRLVQAAHHMEGSDLKLTCVIGHPFGTADADVKRYETETAIDGGAHFIEVVANSGRLKDGDDAGVLRDWRDLVEAADERPVSVVLDPAWLNLEEILRAVRLALDASVKGVTIPALHNPAATLDLAKQIHELAGDNFGLKVDGETFETKALVQFLDAGVTRFGLTRPVALLESL